LASSALYPRRAAVKISLSTIISEDHTKLASLGLGTGMLCHPAHTDAGSVGQY
jgi:hypothetical protein